MTTRYINKYPMVCPNTLICRIKSYYKISYKEAYSLYAINSKIPFANAKLNDFLYVELYLNKRDISSVKLDGSND